MVQQRGALQHRLDAVMTTPTLIPSKLTRALLALLVAGAATIASAQESRQPAQHGEQRASEPRQGEQRQADARESVLRLLPADSVTEHAVAIPGGTLTYTATAGTLSLFESIGRALGRGLLQPPTSPRTPRLRTVPSPSPSTADRARHRPI